MDQEQLTAIIQQVLQEMEKKRKNNGPNLAYLPFQDEKKLQEVITCYETDYNINSWEELQEKPEILVVERLSIGTIGRLASVTVINKTEEIMAEHLLENKPIWVTSEIPLLSDNLIGKQIYKNIETIEKYGVEFLDKLTPLVTIDFTKKSLLTEKDFEKTPNNSKILISNPILTPLAKDRMREKNITLVKQN